MRRCSACKRTKPYPCFYREGSSFTSRCKPCSRAAALAWNKANPEKHKAKLTKWFLDNPEKRNLYDKKYKYRKSLFRKINHEKKRTLAIHAYGGMCSCCGETEKSFLTIDHINGGGNKHRREIGAGRMYYWLANNKYPEGFQVLCMNCNWGKRMNSGICPHEVMRVAVI